MILLGGWRALAKQLRYGAVLLEPTTTVSSASISISSSSISSRISSSSISTSSISSLPPKLGIISPPSRGLSTAVQQISQFMELTLADASPTDVSTPRPLALMYPWLMAKPQHVGKYMRIFTDRGVDVLKVQVTPMDLMQPTTRAQVAASEVLQYLELNPQFDRIVVYGFSVGAYAFAEAAKQIHDNPGRYRSIDRRFVGHIWDSPVDVPNMPPGVAKSVTKNKKLQQFITRYVEWFMKVRHDVATCHYYAASEFFHSGPANAPLAPALYIYANNDPMSDAAINQAVMKSWTDAGMHVMTNIFEKAPHCATYLRYPDEYLKCLHEYLDLIGIVGDTQMREQVAA